MDKYPRLTENQLELWLANPCTQHLFECLKFRIGDINDLLASPSIRQADNNLTCQTMDNLQGQKTGLEAASDPVALFRHYELIEEAEEDVAA
jgi:hypothetical protein